NNHDDRAFGRSDLHGPAAKWPGLEGSVEGRGRRSGRGLCRKRGGEAEEEELLDAHAFGHSKSEGGSQPHYVTTRRSLRKAARVGALQVGVSQPRVATIQPLGPSAYRKRCRSRAHDTS